MLGGLVLHGPTGFCRNNLWPQLEGSAEGVVRSGPSLKRLFPLGRNSCQQLPYVCLRPRCCLPLPTRRDRDLSVGLAPRGAGGCQGCCFLSGGLGHRSTL